MTGELKNLSNIFKAPHTYAPSPRTDPLELSRVDRGEASTWISHRQTPSSGLL